MSLRSLLMPAISAVYLSERRLLRLRAKAEAQRQHKGAPHEVLYFHQVDDPYSALLAAALPALAQRYGIKIAAHIVPPPEDSAAPDRARLIAYSRKDAALLAQRWGLSYSDPGHQPDAALVQAAAAQLVGAAEQGQFLSVVGPLSDALWGGVEKLPTLAAAATPAATQQHLAQAGALRKKWGHYLGATLYYAGEWYWGLDRLHHLEARLQALGLAPQQPVFFPPGLDWGASEAAPESLQAGREIDFFFSLRSPYSAIAAPRIFKLGALTQTPVRLRYVLPMVMRGLPVPAEKRRYITLDAAREARLHGVPFGRVNDPLGRPTERGLALMPLAESLGAGQRYVLSFMEGVWAEGIDAGSDRGLRKIAERAGLGWGAAQDALAADAEGQGTWRAIAERNRQEMTGLGLWGVPSFRVGAFSTWGQDRIWAIQQALTQPAE